MEVSRRDLMLTGAALLAVVKGGSLQALAQTAAAPADGAAWDLTDIYPSDAAWTADRTAIQAEIARLPQLRGTLGRDAAALRTALQTISDTYRKLLKLYIYASLKADEDLRVAPNQERKQQAQDVFTAMGEATAWVEPEILGVGQQTIDRYTAAEQGLGKFRFYLANILRRAPHTLERGIGARPRLVGQRARRPERHSRPARRVGHSAAHGHALDRTDPASRRSGLWEQPRGSQSRRPQARLRQLLGELQAVRKLTWRCARGSGQG